MKKAWVLGLTLAALPAFAAKNLKCQVSDSENKNAKAVQVTRASGALVVEDIVTEYGKNRIVVRHDVGDRYEPQTSLSITIEGKAHSNTYNVSENSLYQLSANGAFVQCHFK